MIDQQLRTELHAQLLTERERLEQEIANFATSGTRSGTFLADESDAVDQHPADAGSELFEREKNMTLQRNLEMTLHEVNEALHRFDEGNYGECEICGQAIAEKRLRARPGSTHCIDCQSKLERQQHIESRS